MPKKVDHQERREQISAALMRVAAREGIEAISLRHVATEAGVTSGMVQHYFPSKEAMMDFAMEVASARFETRMTEAIAALGENPAPKDFVRAILMTLLPMNEAQRADGRVALAFQSYASTKQAAADKLSHGNAGLRDLIAQQIHLGQPSHKEASPIDPAIAASGLLAMTEGLGIYVLSSDLPSEEAQDTLNAYLDQAFAE